MNCHFLLPARAELEEAVQYYNQQQPGLGDELAAEAARTLRRIMEYPLAWTKFSRRSRRCLLNRFPYGLIYQVRPEGILIVAVANLHRKPMYWMDRLKSLQQ